MYYLSYLCEVNMCMTNDGKIHTPAPVYKISKQSGHKNEEREELHVEQKRVSSESYGVIY